MSAPISSLALRVFAVGGADAIGLGMYLALSALFLNQAVGLSTGQVGMILGLTGAASMLGAMPIARAAQKHGLRMGLLTLFILRALAFFSLAFANSFTTALLASALAGLMSRGTAPLVESALIAKDDNSAAVRSLARLRMIRNAGIAAGGLPAGLAVWINHADAYRWVLAISSILFLLAAAICWSFPDKELRSDQAPVHTSIVLRDRPFVFLTLMYGGLTLSAIILGVGLPLWIINQSEAPRWVIGSIQLINTIMVILLQNWASRDTDHWPIAMRQMRHGAIVSVLACILIALGARWGLMADLLIILAVVLLFTLAELYVVAGAEGAALQLIPEGQRPTYLAALNLGFAGATVVGPPLVAWSAGAASWNWLVWAGFFALMLVLMPALSKCKPR